MLPMTMRELARLAGVSQATVSLALRNHPRISNETKARIVTLVKKHKYVVDGRVSELMRTIRVHSAEQLTGCLGLISLYPEEKPWQNVKRRPHLSRLHRSMVKRAGELGYRVEAFWVKNPEMTLKRLAQILEARGIRGLLSLGAPELEEEIPGDLRPFVIVTQGTSIATRLHRILGHWVHDTTLLLTTLKARGYRRPGLILQQHQDGRNAHIIAAMYLYFSRYDFDRLDIPILYAGSHVDQEAMGEWFDQHRPDVLVYYDHENHFRSIEIFLQNRKLIVPRDIGLAVLDATVQIDGVSGVHQNIEQMGVSAVEMVVSRLQQGETALPKFAKVESVEGTWIEGETLRLK